MVIAALISSAVPVSAAEPEDPASTTTTSTTTIPPTTTAPPPTSSAPPPTSSAPPSTTAPAEVTTSSTTTTTPAPDNSTTTTAPADPSTAPETPGPVPAPTLDEAALDEEQVADLLHLQHQYDELVADEAAYLAEYEVRLSEVEQLDADLVVLGEEITRTELQVERARSDVDRIRADLRANEDRLRETAIDLEAAIDRWRQQAVDSFMFAGTDIAGVWDAVLDGDSSQRAEAGYTYANAVVEDQQSTIERIRSLEAELEAINAEIDAKRQAAEEARRQVEALERRLESQRARVRAERERAEAERARIESVLAEIRSRKAAYDQRLQAMVVESDNISGVLARVQRGQLRAAEIPLFRGPVDPTEITSGYGPRMHPIFETLRRHNGVDISGNLGDPIRAIEAGVVVMAEMRNGYGNTIVIDHGAKLASVYAHQSRFEVGVGDVVARGELIGRIGSTGWSTGPHLHLEIRLDGKPIDPAGRLLLNEPLDCELLATSVHPVDVAIRAEREDCRAG